VSLDFPILSFKHPDPESGDPQLIVSPAQILLDDEPIPWPTVGLASIEIADGDVVTLVVRIAVRMRI
jgi:hypothetical protein